jgi:hypothetical protein
MEREESKGEGESGGQTLQSHFAFHLAGETGVEWNDAAAQRWPRSPGRVLLHEAAYIAPLPAGGERISPLHGKGGMAIEEDEEDLSWHKRWPSSSAAGIFSQDRTFLPRLSRRRPPFFLVLRIHL